jgi:hypothetical protein
MVRTLLTMPRSASHIDRDGPSFGNIRPASPKLWKRCGLDVILVELDASRLARFEWICYPAGKSKKANRNDHNKTTGVYLSRHGGRYSTVPEVTGMMMSNSDTLKFQRSKTSFFEYIHYHPCPPLFLNNMYKDMGVYGRSPGRRGISQADHLPAKKTPNADDWSGRSGDSPLLLPFDGPPNWPLRRSSSLPVLQRLNSYRQLLGWSTRTTNPRTTTTTGYGHGHGRRREPRRDQ